MLITSAKDYLLTVEMLIFCHWLLFETVRLRCHCVQYSSAGSIVDCRRCHDQLDPIGITPQVISPYLYSILWSSNQLPAAICSYPVLDMRGGNWDRQRARAN